MAKFSLPALDFTIQFPIKVKKKKFQAYKDPAVTKGFTGKKKIKNQPLDDMSWEQPVIAEEEPSLINTHNVFEIGDNATGTGIVGEYATLREEILSEQLRTLGHVRKFTVKQVIPALVQLFEKKRNRRFRKFELMAMEGYVHGISHGMLGKALNQGPFEANKIQMKNGQWRTQRNNASWRIEMSHWNGKEDRYQCERDVCVKCKAIEDFWNAQA